MEATVLVIDKAEKDLLCFNCLEKNVEQCFFNFEGILIKERRKPKMYVLFF
jgi:hypothetical protein